MTAAAGAGSVPRPVLDLRLLGAAAGSWLGAVAGGRLPVVASWSVSACACSTVVLLLIRGGGGSRAMAVGLLSLGAGLSVAAVGLHSRTSGPVAAAARHALTAMVQVSIASDPRKLPVQPHLPPSIAISARIDALEIAGRWSAVRQPVLLLAPATSWGALLPSTRLRAVAAFRPPEQPDVAAVLVVHGSPTLIRGPTAVQRWAGRVRAGLRGAAARLPASERGLLPGLVVGDTSEEPAADTASFRAAGLSHLTAVSGANLAMVVAAVFGILAWLRVGIRFRALVSAIALLAFVILARPSPSVMRAAIMGLLALAAIGLGRPRMLTSAAFVAVTLLSLFDPMLVGQPGFALSVLATLALVLVAPGWTGAISARLPARLRPVAAGAAVALAAQAACAPVLAAINGGISLVSVPANVLALPAVPPATVLGLAAALTSLVSPAAAGLICDLAGVPCWWLIHVARWAQQLPLSHLTTPTGAWGFVVVLMLDVAVVLAVRRRSGRRTVAFAVISLVAVSLASGSPATGPAT